MNKIPRIVLVPVVISIGILLLVLSQEPHSPCDSQVDVFIENQSGHIFQAKKGKDKSPQYRRFLATCREGASPGACYELFALIRKMVRDLSASPLNCIDQFQRLPELQRALGDTVEVLVIMAWGNQPPETGTTKFAWLETSDMALFCQLKQNYIQFFGQEKFEVLRGRIQAVLPGEPILIGSDGKCQNCNEAGKDSVYKRQRAIDLISSDEIWRRSLFAIRCEQYF